MPFFLHLGSKQQVESLKQHYRDFPAGAVVKNPPANAGDARDAGSIPGWGRSPGGGHGNHSSILAWKIPSAEEPGGLQSTGLQRVGHDRVTEYAHRIASLTSSSASLCTSKAPCGDAGSVLMIQAYLPD